MSFFVIALRRLVLGLALGIVGVLAATSARATILGLGDGTYDVALTCVFADCAPAGPRGPYMGTLTVSGNDVTDWSFTFPQSAYSAPGGESFGGNPDEFVDIVSGFDAISGFGDDLFGQLQITNSQTWHVFVSGGIDVLYGSWVAVLQEVPEPLSVIVLLCGLAALGVHRGVGPSSRGF